MRAPLNQAKSISIAEGEENEGFDACGWILIILSYFLVIITFPIAAFYCTNVSFGSPIIQKVNFIFYSIGCSRISTCSDLSSWTDFTR